MGYINEIRKLVGHRPLLLTGAVVVIVDSAGDILLQQRAYPKGSWGLPGGLMELGESTEQTAEREVFEETGLKVKNLQLLNVYSGAKHFSVAENGDEFYVVTIAYLCKDYEGDIQADGSESVDVQFFSPDKLPEKMVGSHREMIKDYLRIIGWLD